MGKMKLFGPRPPHLEPKPNDAWEFGGVDVENLFKVTFPPHALNPTLLGGSHGEVDKTIHINVGIPQFNMHSNNKQLL